MLTRYCTGADENIFQIWYLLPSLLTLQWLLPFEFITVFPCVWLCMSTYSCKPYFLSYSYFCNVSALNIGAHSTQGLQASAVQDNFPKLWISLVASVSCISPLKCLKNVKFVVFCKSLFAHEDYASFAFTLMGFTYFTVWQIFNYVSISFSLLVPVVQLLGQYLYSINWHISILL